VGDVSTLLPEVQDLILECDADTLTIWFNRPESRNALSARMAAELAQVLEVLPRARDLRFIILRGKGGSFCSGGDLSMFRTVFQGGASREDIVAANASFGRLLRSVRALPQLFVVGIEGAAMAGGLGLSCIADVVITTANARFALSEVTLGIPPAQITSLVIQRVGASEARRLLLTAQRFDGLEAGRLGFAHQVVADSNALDEALATLLDDARRGAPGAIALTKDIIAASAALEPDALVQFAAERFADAMLGEEAREGMAAFAAKRQPQWAQVRSCSDTGE